MSTWDKAADQSQDLRWQRAPQYKERASFRPARRGAERGRLMRSRRTAVLGGSGFIGRYIVKRLAARGDVVAVGCRNAEAAKFLRTMGDVGQVEPLNIGIDDENLLPAFLAGS